VVEEYYGTKVDDPYHYMENLQDPQAAAWFKAQAAFTELLSKPYRAAVLYLLA
jgi:prolyl oligopeptidase PreP (S9A serine peptidase family)